MKFNKILVACNSPAVPLTDIVNGINKSLKVDYIINVADYIKAELEAVMSYNPLISNTETYLKKYQIPHRMYLDKCYEMTGGINKLDLLEKETKDMMVLWWTKCRLAQDRRYWYKVIRTDVLDKLPEDSSYIIYNIPTYIDMTLFGREFFDSLYLYYYMISTKYVKWSLGYSPSNMNIKRYFNDEFSKARFDFKMRVDAFPIEEIVDETVHFIEHYYRYPQKLRKTRYKVVEYRKEES